MSAPVQNATPTPWRKIGRAAHCGSAALAWAAQRKRQPRPHECSEGKKAPRAAFRGQSEDRRHKGKNGYSGGPAEARAHSRLPGCRIEKAPERRGECIKPLEADRKRRSGQPDAEKDENGDGSGTLDLSKP